MRRPLLAGPLLAVLLLAGCSSGDDDTAAASSPAPATTAAASSASSSAPAAATGCPAAATGQSSGVPATAESKATLDVDGDGRPDTVWIDDETASGGTVRFGIATASGGGFAADFTSASPVTRSVLVADVTGDGEFVALASDGRAVQLWAVSDCSLVSVQNGQGEQYTFDLGFTGFGTGVGCADVDGDGARDLVGLLADSTSITSTVVDLDGPQASNGTSSTIADATAQQLDLAHQVSCGDLTMAADGVTVPQ